MRAIAIALAVGLPLALLAPERAAANRQRNFDKQKFKIEYRSALDRFARGEAEEALATLVELEARSEAETGSDLDPLWKSKLSVIRALLKAGPELLVPVSQLHEQAYLAHLERGSYLLASHSRTMTIELAELYAERARDSHGERLASAVMTSMAGHLHAGFMDSTATALYQRALKLHPKNVAALLGLAGIFERHGEYRKALPLLRDAATTAPDNAEGHLRLAVHQIRLGESDPAEKSLRRLLEDPVKEPRWVYALAYQELARVLIDRDDFEAATELLEQAGRALPGDPTLPILLAYVSDRARRPSSKSELATALRAPVAPGADSPRYRYSQMPRQALEHLRASLRGESAAQLPTLAEALSSDRMLAAARSR